MSVNLHTDTHAHTDTHTLHAKSKHQTRFVMSRFVGGHYCLQCRRSGFSPGLGKIPWRRKWLLFPVLLPRDFHGQRSLTGYSPWGHKKSDTSKQLTLKSWTLMFIKPLSVVCVCVCVCACIICVCVHGWMGVAETHYMPSPKTLTNMW